MPSEPSKAGRPCDESIYTDGRPDFPGWKRFGITEAKGFPTHVYSANKMGLLMHKIASVELHWWAPVDGGERLVRLDKPRMIARTACNQSKFIEPGRAHTCAMPEPSAILCGRCHGGPATFSKTRKQTVSKQYAKDHLGCVVGELTNAQR
jgi:hypothetical protein